MQGYNDNSNIHRSEQFKKSQHFELDFYNKLTVYSGSCKLYEYEFMPKSWESSTPHPQSQSAGFIGNGIDHDLPAKLQGKLTETASFVQT